MANFSAKGEGLWRNFAISATQHPNCLDFPFKLQDPSLSDSSWALTPLSNGGQLCLVTRGAEYCSATAVLLRTRAKARAQILKK